MSFKTFIEMARRREAQENQAIPIFDEYDQRYYKYILDNIPDEIIEQNPRNVPMIIRQAICLRYGQNRYKTNTFDHDFQVFIPKRSKLTIKNIPNNYDQIKNKISNLGWNNDADGFGYARGHCYTPFMIARAEEYIKFFRTGEMPPRKDLYYHPKFDYLSNNATDKDFENREFFRNRKLSKSYEHEISDEIKQAIINDRENGATRKQLSNTYKIGLITLTKILKDTKKPLGTRNWQQRNPVVSPTSAIPKEIKNQETAFDLIPKEIKNQIVIDSRNGMKSTQLKQKYNIGYRLLEKIIRNHIIN